MLQPLLSIFGLGEKRGTYPEALVAAATERAVDGTDSRLRLLPGYKKKLRPAILQAIDHVVALTDDLGSPLELGAGAYGTDPEITAYFASADHLQDVLALDPQLVAWRKSSGAVADRMVALLLMEQRERKVFGHALEGDRVLSDVAQTTVSFTEHRLVDPAPNLDEALKLLRRRAFDHLLMLALARMGEAQAERGALEQERALLKRKLAALHGKQIDFNLEAKPQENAEAHADIADVQAQLEDIESQLNTLGAGSQLLSAHLDILAHVLVEGPQQLWKERETLIVDRMGIKQVQATALAPAIELRVLRNAAGRRAVARLVTAARSTLPPLRNPLREAERLLGGTL
jgi:hypothetical protein